MSELVSNPASDERHADRQALRALLREVASGINRKDWEAVEAAMAPHVVITMIDQVSLHGTEALSDYITSKIGRFSSVLADLQVDPVPDAPAVFYGDTAVCTLSSADRFIFRNGQEFLVNNRYTATLLKQDGSWKLAALHGGTNAFNNPISFQAQRFLTGGIALAGAGGALLGWLVGKQR